MRSQGPERLIGQIVAGCAIEQHLGSGSMGSVYQACRLDDLSPVVVKIMAEDGTVGWGQSVPTPRWSYETIESVKTTIDRYFVPELIGRDAFDLGAIDAVMDRYIAPSFTTGQPICKAGIDLALFDLTGKRLGQSAAQRFHADLCGLACATTERRVGDNQPGNAALYMTGKIALSMITDLDG